jgi:hypothetical protein
MAPRVKPPRAILGLRLGTRLAAAPTDLAWTVEIADEVVPRAPAAQTNAKHAKKP